ncbi:MAG: hypothetical protein VSS75_000180 [Candidatus Parabeggiatoa sp.]|nr:hypothetical protein [Candidatus Parabeggiatoa sp.]
MFLEVLVEGGADVPTIREIKKHQRRKAEILRPPKKVALVFKFFKGMETGAILHQIAGKISRSVGKNSL